MSAIKQDIIPAADVPPPSVQPASPLDLPVEVFTSGLARRKENRAALMDWVRSALVEGVDYGCIPTRRGPSKPSLWKPGAEKICGMLGVSVRFPTLNDYEQAALGGVQLEHIIVRCEIRDASDRVVADGVGARSLQQDYGDINKALKMAEKSAHIDATLRMAGLSEVFTQDLEDMAHGKDMEAQTAHPQGDRVSRATPPARITAAQHQQLEEHITTLGVNRARLLAWLRKASHGRVTRLQDMTPAMYTSVESRLEAWAQETEPA
jgi:hypothetical protein